MFMKPPGLEPKVGRGLAFINKLQASEPQLVQKLFSDALKDCFSQHGGNPDALVVTFGRNKHERQGEDGEVVKYPVSLRLHFLADPGCYEVPHDDVVQAFAHELERGFYAAGGNHKPGFFHKPAKGEEGDYTAEITHLDAAHVAGVVSKVLQRHHQISLDTRLMGEGHGADRHDAMRTR